MSEPQHGSAFARNPGFVIGSDAWGGDALEDDVGEGVGVGEGDGDEAGAGEEAFAETGAEFPGGGGGEVGEGDLLDFDGC